MESSYIYIYRQHTGLWNPSKNTIPQELEKNEVQLQQAPDLNIHMFIYMVFIQICFHNFLQAVVYIIGEFPTPGPAKVTSTSATAAPGTGADVEGIATAETLPVTSFQRTADFLHVMGESPLSCYTFGILQKS